MVSLKQLLAKKQRLNPTATVVRKRDGTVQVERKDLLNSKSEVEEKINASVSAGKIQEEEARKQREAPLSPETLRDEQVATLLLRKEAPYEFILDHGSTNGEGGGGIHGGKWEQVHPSAQCTNHRKPGDADDNTFSNHSLMDVCRKQGRLRVATWNIWFARYEWEVRLDALLDRLVRGNKKENGEEEGGVDILCLQEVSAPQVVRKILNDPGVQDGYRFCTSSDEQRPDCRSFVDGCFYGLLILVKKSLPIPTIKKVKLPSRMGRSILAIEFPIYDEENEIGEEGQGASASSTKNNPIGYAAIATVHLESLRSQETRKRQLEIISKYILGGCNFAMLVGDSNISATGPYGDPAELEDANKGMNDAGFTDLWIREKGTAADDEDAGDEYYDGITFDTRVTHPMKAAAEIAEAESEAARILQKSGKSKCGAAAAATAATTTRTTTTTPSTAALDSTTIEHSRLDRMFVKEGKDTTGARLVAKDIKIIGKEPIHGSLFVSDHYGLVCDLAVVGEG